MTRFVVGAPVWDRAWSLDLWFDAIEANVPPDETGLVFVVPPADEASRAVIAERSEIFAWTEVLRDKNQQFDREHRGLRKHETLAAARNQIMSVVAKAKPDWFISWDSDLLIQPGLVEQLVAYGRPITTVWTWLNRQPPQRIRYWDAAQGKHRMVEWQPPMQATAMDWESDGMRARHKSGRDWDRLAQGNWKADVVLGFQLMSPNIYNVGSYGAHPDGEDIPFNWQLEKRGVERWVCGEKPGLHLYTRETVELELGYPAIMDLARARPLQAERQSMDTLDEALGFYAPLEESTHQEETKV